MKSLRNQSLEPIADAPAQPRVMLIDPSGLLEEQNMTLKDHNKENGNG